MTANRRLAILRELTTLYPMLPDGDIEDGTLEAANCETVEQYRRFARAVALARREAEDAHDGTSYDPVAWKRCLVTAKTPEAEVAKAILASVK